MTDDEKLVLVDDIEDTLWALAEDSWKEAEISNDAFDSTTNTLHDIERCQRIRGFLLNRGSREQGGHPVFQGIRELK